MLLIDTPVDREELNRILNEHLSGNSGYLNALEVVKRNSSGKIWLVGSGVYKTFLNFLYDHTHSIKDWDFIAERIFFPLELANGWTAEKNKHGNPKLTKGELVADLIDLRNIHSIKERKLEPDIEHYLTGTPLTIQSVAFDIDKKAVIGEMGIESVLTKTVGINNMKEHEYAAEIYGDRYSAKRYAELLGFTEV